MNGLKVSKAGVVSSRPLGTIGPNVQDGPWQTFAVEVPSSLTRLLLSVDSTFHLIVTDCRPGAGELRPDHQFNLEGYVSAEDVYVDGRTLNGSSDGHVRPRENIGPMLQGVAYVSASRIKNVPELCFQAQGGTMFGLGFKSPVIRVRQ
jgi:hypothetical protein